MASTVTVFETSARRTVIKVSPGKYLHEVRAEACQKFRLNPDRYGLKHNNKTLDLSTIFRQTGLAAGARLELTLLASSTGVVNVALQLPEAEATDVPNGRLVDKFPSSTTLWQILRKFEDGVAGAKVKKNLTARGFPLLTAGAAGAGRLYYEQPVLMIMNKELATFVDLQKTLSTLGLNTGNVLVKLTFKTSEQPFEEAQTQIGTYFQELEGSERELLNSKAEELEREAKTAAGTAPAASEQTSSKHIPVDAAVQGTDGGHLADPEETPATAQASTDDKGDTAPASILGITDRPTTVYSAPSESTPKAASLPHNEADYNFTVEHAKLQHAAYKTAGRNKTLLSDAELEAQKQEAADKAAAVQSVRIRTRFPDNTQAVATFNQQDTGEDLYAHVRKLLKHENAPFVLHYRGPKGMNNVPDDKKKLIQLGALTGDATIFLTWQDGAGPEIRSDPSLKSQVTAAAQQVEVPSINDENDAGGTDEKENLAPEKPEKTARKGGVPAWLKKSLPGGKK